MQTFLEQLLFLTVRITTRSSGGEGLGTGFILAEKRPEGGSGLLLVTNMHVIEGADEIRLHFLRTSADGQPLLGQEKVLFTRPEAFAMHPDDDVDVALLGIGGALETCLSAGEPLFFRSVSPDMCATSEMLDEFEPIEPVIFVGYPNGLYDTSSLLPIVRQGHAATAMNVDYRGKPMFLIDASVFPGSSGSPVFLTPRLGAFDKHGNLTLTGPTSPVLLGIVAAVHQRAVPVQVSIPGGGTPFVYDPINLGIVHKASEIRKFAVQLLRNRSTGPEPRA